ncbi:MAG: SDR family NAD(P)-dependent oxidoreductase [Alphaproteobacteria bacterium]|nr:SDR family NAD(P)-dependent oxidoreductase [Alphaproteobacteria bacterium]
MSGYADKSVLVTGADGFIGSHLAERLVTEGAQVTALALYNAFDSHGWLDSLPEDSRTQMRLVRGDLRDVGFTLRLVEGHDLVFHLAALIAIPHSYAAPQSYVDVNVTGTLNVLEAARAAGVERTVHTSTSEVYGTAQVTPITEDHPLQGQSPYAASKIGADMMAEAYARSFDLPVVILRPFNTYGPRQSERAVISSVIRQALDPACDAIRVGDLSPQRDFTYVSDTVEAFLAAGSADAVDHGAAYNAGSGAAVTVGDMVEQVRSITGANKPIEVEQARLRPDKSEVRALLADASRFRSVTDWRPQVSLEQGLTRTVDWWHDRMREGGVRVGSEYVT